MSEPGAVAVDSGELRPAATPLEVGSAEVLVGLATFAGSLAVLLYGMSAFGALPIFLVLHFGVLLVPAWLCIHRRRRNGDLTLPALLVLATLVSGPVGALGCLALALMLRRGRATPARLKDWYDYIAGVVARPLLTHIYEELQAGRLPSDPIARVPRFRSILHGPSMDEQQRVLAVMGRHYHPDFRASLREAMRHPDPLIRAQAAAVAAGLDAEEKQRLWSGGYEVLPPAPVPTAAVDGKGDDDTTQHAR